MPKASEWALQFLILMLKVLFYLFCTLSALSFGAGFPFSDELIEASLMSMKTYVAASENVKKEKFDKLKSALKFSYSVTANQAFWDYLNLHWDSTLSKEAKKRMMEQAEEHALAEANNKMQKFMQMKNDDGKFQLSKVLNEAMPSNTATETYYERDKFIGEDGKLDFRIADFGLNSSVPLKDRIAADPVVWADDHFTGTSKERQKKSEELKNRYYSYSGTYGFTTHSSSNTSLGACGTPSSQAPALRPESHGWR